ncbi:hypothetical protein AB8989_04945 [Yersinia hibernica]|uniref:hypothetical protein n=1 Tax=Yersinia hibernica TaxID=2339259 RepID=UPI0013904CCF|nr:hypothetical protein [Yersinia hibernica]
MLDIFSSAAQEFAGNTYLGATLAVVFAHVRMSYLSGRQIHSVKTLICEKQ